MPGTIPTKHSMWPKHSSSSSTICGERRLSALQPDRFQQNKLSPESSITPPSLPEHPAYQGTYLWYVEEAKERERILAEQIELLADEYEKHEKPKREWRMYE